MSDTISPQPNETPSMSLRERKKRLVQTTIEETALRLFQEQGYEHTSIQDIANAVVMSTRTFFRYFASKEEVLFGPLYQVLDEGVRFLQLVAARESPQQALKETFLYMVGLYQQRRESFLLRYHVAVQTPPVASAYIYALLERETSLCDALCTSTQSATDRREIQTWVAIFLTAFRLALILWLEREAQDDLDALFREQLDYVSSFAR
jgi:AcrR family transcriptional regulator